MKIRYRQIFDGGLRREITEARYKGVITKLEEFDNLVFIYGIESSNESKGECQEMIDILIEDFKGKRLGSSPPVSEASKHILDKKGISYKEFMRNPEGYF